MNLIKFKIIYPRWPKKLQNLPWVLEFQVKTWFINIFLLESARHNVNQSGAKMKDLRVKVATHFSLETGLTTELIKYTYTKQKIFKK